MNIRDVGMGKRVSFEVYATSILGNNYRNVRLEGIISARGAIAYNVDIQSLHNNVYATLPPGTVADDPFSYDYIRVRMVSGEYVTLGIPWIRADTVELGEGGSMTLVFNDVTSIDQERILAALNSNGYKPNNIRTDAQ